MENIGDIFTFVNVDLLDGELDQLSDIINYLEEGQNIICTKSPLEASPLPITLTTNQIILPSDFSGLSELWINGREVEPIKIWKNIMYLKSSLISGTGEMYYYRKPTPLDPTNDKQVPDIDKRYWPSLGKFAAGMYKLKDEDLPQRDAFRQEFLEGLQVYTTTKRYATNFRNLGM